MVCRTTYDKVNVLLDTSAALEKLASGKEISMAQVADGCKVIGWKDVPHVGAEVLQVDSERRAKEVIQWRLKQQSEEQIVQDAEHIAKQRKIARQAYVEYRMQKLKAGVHRPIYGRHDFYVREKEAIPDSDERARVVILLKFDVDGSKDAILSCLDTYDGEEVKLDVLEAEVGEVTQSDIQFASHFQVRHCMDYTTIRYLAT